MDIYEKNNNDKFRLIREAAGKLLSKYLKKMKVLILTNHINH